jgi:hypothetical protein
MMGKSIVGESEYKHSLEGVIFRAFLCDEYAGDTFLLRPSAARELSTFFRPSDTRKKK